MRLDTYQENMDHFCQSHPVTYIEKSFFKAFYKDAKVIGILREELGVGSLSQQREFLY